MSTLPERIGPYEILSALGEGGMGSLYLARDPEIERRVAIKVLREGIDSEEIRFRFAREARSAGRLSHPNIVTIFHVGEYERQPFIAMEYIPGKTLAQLIAAGDELPLARKLQIMEEVCDGLAYAHEAGIVHRDVKPANIIVNLKGTVKILDFGIARVSESSSTLHGSGPVTQLGAVIGTPNYMSPEQIMGESVDLRSDVFSVGLVTYELLTYRRAFEGTLSQVMYKILNTDPAPLEELCPGIDPDIPRIVARAIEKDAAKRWDNLTAMRRDLARVRTRLEAAGQQHTVIVPTPPSGTQGRDTALPPSGPRGLDPKVIQARRAKRIEQHVEAARSALEAGEYETAVEECEQAATLDATDSRVLDLLERARSAIEIRRARDLIEGAKKNLQKGELTAASRSLDQAAPLSLASDLTADVRRDLELLRAEIAQARERAARAAEERARQEAREAAVREAIDAAQESFANRNYDAAIAMLEAITPPHEAASRVLGMLRLERAEIERHARQQEEELARSLAEEQRRRRDEAVRAAAAEVERARGALESGDTRTARMILSVIELDPSLGPDAATVLRQVDDVRLGCEADDLIADARRCTADGDLGLAATLIDRAAAMSPKRPALVDARRELEAARVARKPVAAPPEPTVLAPSPPSTVAPAVPTIIAPVTVVPPSPPTIVLPSRQPQPVAVPRGRTVTTTVPATSAPVGGKRPPFVIVGGVVAAIAVLIVSWIVLRPRPETGPPVETAAPAVSQPSAAAAPAAESAPTNPAPASASAAAPPSPGPAAAPTEDAEKTALARAAEALGRGDRVGALSKLEDGLKASPSSAALQRQIDSMLQDASSAAGRANEAAVRAQAPKLAADEYREGTRSQTTAARDQRTRKPAAIRGFWAAAETFGRAAEKAAASLRAANPSAPAPATQVAEQAPKPAEPVPAAPTPAPVTPSPTGAAAPPPSQPQAPKPDPPAPNPSSAQSDTAAIQDVLRQYTQAYERLDVALLVKLMPSAPANDLRRSFSSMKSYKLNLQDVNIAVRGDTAVVTCTREITVSLKVGGQQRVAPKTTLQLRRAGSTWIIESQQ